MTHRWLTSLFLLVLTTAAAKAEDFYFVMVLGSQQDWPNPRFAHTFATFVKVSAQEPCPDTFTIEEVHTISWLAATMVVKPALLPEPGTNFELRETIQWALDTCQRVSMWGPYQINEDLYCRALRQIDLLESCRVRYKAVDSGYPSSRVSNCIHAISSIAGGYRLRVVSPEWGETASYYVVRRLRRWYVNPEEKHEWLAAALGLEEYPIISRDMQNPRSDVFWSAIRLVTGAGIP